MNIERDITLQTLKSKLNFANIPGWGAQMQMSPPYRQALVDEGKFDLKNPRIAAVLILIYEENGILKFPVIHRNTYPGVHSNQVGFPGGKIESEDQNLAETAIRESQEEIKAIPDKIEILGELTELFIPPSNFLVYPFVGLYHDLPQFEPSDLEVKKIIPMNLIEFLQNSKKTELTVHSHGKDYQVPAFDLENGPKIWGATAMMLNEFHTFLTNSLDL